MLYVFASSWIVLISLGCGLYLGLVNWVRSNQEKKKKKLGPVQPRKKKQLGSVQKTQNNNWVRYFGQVLSQFKPNLNWNDLDYRGCNSLFLT